LSAVAHPCGRERRAPVPEWAPQHGDRLHGRHRVHGEVLQRVDSSAIRDALGSVNAGELDLRTSKIQTAGPNTYTITTQLLNVETDESVINSVEAALKARFPGADVNRELIGEQISRELARRPPGYPDRDGRDARLHLVRFACATPSPAS